MQVTAKSWEYAMKKQRGGTLLGLVIGALLGLGIALIVAVYVTKVPVPFMNKSPTHSPDSDAAETKKNRDWNPNAPLAGKNPARPAPPPEIPEPPEPVEPSAPSASGELTLPPPEDVISVPDPVVPPSVVVPPERVVKKPKPAPTVATPSPAPSPAPAPAHVPAPAPTPAIVAKPSKPSTPQSADPLGDLAKSRSESTVFSSGVDPFNYFIQAGAYRTPEDAEQQRARLLLLGMQARVTEREQAGRTVYRVRVGPFDKKDDAEKIKDRLDNNSIETALVRVQR
ncbi:MAG: Sporulation domain protein [Polaromonas sp.]|nr:Sporulation domain protein [Polaromonas sp.]